MSDKMKIHPYEIKDRVSIVSTIQGIDRLPLARRLRPVYGYNMKMETLTQQKVGNSTVFFMDFCKHRLSGPGRAKVTAKTTGFKLGRNEAFGEMTAILYDPATAFVVAQYNHYGPRPGSIAAYISLFHGGNNITFLHCLKPNVLAEIDKKQFNTSVSFEYSPAALTEAHRNSLGIFAGLDSLELPGSGTGSIQMTFKKKRGKFPKMHGQVEFLKGLYQMVSAADSPITLARVDGAMNEDEKTTFLDLVKAKISDEREGVVINPTTQLPSFASRCDLLAEAFSDWKSAGIITSDVLR